MELNVITKIGYLFLVIFKIPVAIAFFVFTSDLLSAQEKAILVPDGTEGLTLQVPVIDSVTGKATNLDPNVVRTGFSTFKLGMGFIGEYVAYSQSDIFKQQMDSAGLQFENQFKVRDFRILASGLFNTKREFSWKFAYMYDGDKNEWLIRESGLTIGVPELAGRIFIGRTKEGYSMVKVMNGHSPWTAERQMAIDAVPILADGIKYFGSFTKSRIFWNLGYFNDLLSKGQGFSTYEWQYDARVGWLPFYDKENNRLLHLAVNLRYGKPLEGQFRNKSRPESNPAPYILDTGNFPADHAFYYGGEVYYNTGRWMVGSELVVQKYMATGSDHQFFGGDIVASYFLTKTIRPYRTDASLFGFVKVNKSIFKGGLGEWEAVLRLSSLNLNDGDIQGGSFWRITPMVNWYMSKILRTEFIYGYGQLDRYNLKGNVQFFQFRVQLTMM